jgi:hypothetical protein
MTPYFLQIGYNGITHLEGQTSAPSEVVFGASGGPTYNSGQLSQRQSTQPSDGFDVQINAVPSIPGDYSGNGSVGTEDFVFWKASFGQNVLPGDGADGNNDGVIDAADFVLWRGQVAPGSPLPGDYDGDGTVGPADYAVWRSAFGQGVAPGASADGNTNGVIDAADYVFWRKRLGIGSGASGLTADASRIAVPEPSSGALGLISLILEVLRRRDRRSVSES